MNISNKVDKEALENARIERDMRNNPVSVEPGMDDYAFEDDPLFNGDEVFEGSGGSDPFDSGDFGGFGDFGGSSMGWGSGFGQPPEQSSNTDMEDKFFKSIGAFFVGVGVFAKTFVESFSEFNAERRVKTGKTIMIISSIITIIGVVTLLFGVGLWLDLLVGGLISLSVGVTLFLFSVGDYLDSQSHQQETDFQFDSEPEGINFDDDDDDMNFSFDDEDDDEELIFDEEDFFNDDISEDDNQLELDDDLDFFTNQISSDNDIEKTMEGVLEEVSNNNGMYTRQYLYERITSCLQSINPDYDKVREVREHSDEFDTWDAIIQSSANIIKPKSIEKEDMPYLISVKDKLFYVILEVKRANWIKNLDSFVTEIVNICGYDEKTGRMNETIYGSGVNVGDKSYIKIMKGETAIVSIKDLYKTVEGEILNHKNQIPVVLGIDLEGEVVWKDFKSINTILVTGMPRSGKSWHLSAVIAQMLMYSKPSELQFHILDPKGSVSDFKIIDTPHVRKFVSDNTAIIEELKYIVNVEAPRRKKIIGDAGFVNIGDYKAKNPDADMPLLYVLIDEVVTLAETMTNAEKEEYQSLLMTLVSQLPNLGIRLFMIPHFVKNEVLRKSITDLIPCRISVMGDEAHIEKSLGVKKFEHRLLHVGDMAVKFGNDKPMFVHSAVITDSNEGNKEFFNFLTKFWIKLEPESVKGSLYEQNLRKMTPAERKVKIEEVDSTPSGVSPFGIEYSELDDLLKGIHDNN